MGTKLLIKASTSLMKRSKRFRSATITAKLKVNFQLQLRQEREIQTWSACESCGDQPSSFRTSMCCRCGNLGHIHSVRQSSLACVTSCTCFGSSLPLNLGHSLSTTAFATFRRVTQSYQQLIRSCYYHVHWWCRSISFWTVNKSLVPCICNKIADSSVKSIAGNEPSISGTCVLYSTEWNRDT